MNIEKFITKLFFGDPIRGERIYEKKPTFKTYVPTTLDFNTWASMLEVSSSYNEPIKNNQLTNRV